MPKINRKMMFKLVFAMAPSIVVLGIQINNIITGFPKLITKTTAQKERCKFILKLDILKLTLDITVFGFIINLRATLQ